MIVNWDIQSWEDGSASIVANVDEIKDSLYAYIDRENEKVFKAMILESPYSSVTVAAKTDPSLIELMNWVEEELKFRMSHE